MSKTCDKCDAPAVAELALIGEGNPDREGYGCQFHVDTTVAAYRDGAWPYASLFVQMLDEIGFQIVERGASS